ncbi:MAG: ferredoxin reductase [Naasia sp.]
MSESASATTAPGATGWTPATLLGGRTEASGTRTLVLDAPDLRPSLAGQHIDIRLTAEDGYTAQRSYSLASAAGVSPIEVTIDRLPDGEVSPYLVDGIEPGDLVEVRGPIGLWFVWRPAQTEPVTLLAGGSGIVPLMSMIRTRRLAGQGGDFRLLYSTRSPERDIYRDELAMLAAEEDWLTVHTLYSRQAPPADARGARRIDAEDLATLAFPAASLPTVYICGPTPFVEAVADAVTAAGHDPSRVRAERFGATG